MTTIDAATGIIEISDPMLGVVWSLNVNTGAMSQIINLSDMKPVSGDEPYLGVNGIHYTSDTLYYTSTNQQLFVSLPVSSTTGAAAGNAKVVAGNFDGLDDFDLDDVPNAYIATNSTALNFVRPNGQVIGLAGGDGTSTIPGITGAKFGRGASDKEVIYMGTTGGSEQYVTGTYTTPGAILKIDIGAAGYFDST